MDGRKQIASAVKDYIARERLSREQFAFKTRLGKSTVDKLLIGLFSDRTLTIVEEHTKLQLRPLLAGAALEPDDDARAAFGPLPAVERPAPEIQGERFPGERLPGKRPAMDRPSIAVLP